MEAFKIKTIYYERTNSVGFFTYFTYFNILFVIEYSHEVNIDNVEDLDTVINEIIGNNFEITYLENSNIWY